MESLEEQIKRFLVYDSGDGSGHDSDSGSGSGYGPGSGSGYDDGSGYGYGDGSGNSYCYPYDSGSGYRSNGSYGSIYGYGYGYGNCSGDRIKSYNGQKVYDVDYVLTLIYSVFGNYARGAILRDDLTLQSCYIAKVGNFFAHGKTLREARRDAENKFQRNRPLEDRIEEFIENHPKLDTPYGDLFTWHNILTGSCEMGRKEWCKAHGYEPTDSITVREFISGTVDDYGGDVIRQLAERYKIKTS